MTELQARLIAARAVRAAQAQEDFARRLRPGGGIPTQRSSDTDDAQAPLTLVTGVSA